MRVGLTLYGSLDERSGGFRYDRKLVEGLRAAGDTVHVIELPWRSYHRGILDSIDPQFHDRLDADVDVMLQDELAHPSLVGHNGRLPYPVVSIVHHLRASEPRRLSPLYRAVERRYLSTVDGVVCNSEPTSQSVLDLGVDPASTVVAPPAGDRVDPKTAPSRTTTQPPDAPLKAVFVGNITPRKGLDTLVDGIAACDRPVDLTVVGRPVDEAYVNSVRQSVAAHGLADHVEFVGRCSDEELAKRLQSGDVLAVPSRYEGFGIVYLEGMSVGLPAIASRAGGASDIVSDGETGYLVDPEDSAAVGDALANLAEDRDALQEMSEAARACYEAHPDWTETTERVRQLLAEVAA